MSRCDIAFSTLPYCSFYSRLKSFIFFTFKVKAKIENTCKGEFDQTFLASLIEWLNNVVFDWMKKILPPKGKQTVSRHDKSVRDHSVQCLVCLNESPVYFS